MSATHAVVYLSVTDSDIEETPLFGFSGEPEFIDYQRAVCEQYEHLAVRSVDDVEGDAPVIEDEDGSHELVYRTAGQDGRPILQNLERVTIEDVPSSLQEQVDEFEHVRFQPFEAAPPFDDS